MGRQMGHVGLGDRRRKTVKKRTVFFCGVALVAVASCSPKGPADGVEEEKGTETAPPAQDLEARYAAQLAELRQEIIKGLPIAGMQEVADYEAACIAEKGRRADLEAAKKELGRVATAKALVAHAKNKWIGGADKGIAETEAMLKSATTDADRKAAQDKLAEWRKNRQEGVDALAERQSKLDKALAEEPALIANVKAVEESLKKARADTLSRLGRIGKDGFLASDKIAAYASAFEAEKRLGLALKDAKAELGKIRKARGLVGHAKNKWIGGAEKGMAKAQAMLKDAATEDERQAAREELAKCRESREAGVKALAERQAALDALLDSEPALTEAVEAGTRNLAEARAAVQTALEQLGVNTVLKSDALDAKLAKFVVLLEATPKGLAEFAGQGAEQEKLVDRLLADTDLMLQMLKADGAQDGRYGQAMKIYTDIRKASSKARESGILQRLALAVALQHAQPVKQRNATALTDAPEFVDPVKRYLSYEKAYLAGELDRAFKGLNAWELRMVIYGSEPDEISAWGREMLRSYRPDHIANPDYRWRYVAAVRTEIRYRFGYGELDKPEYQFYQNILMNGGVCGRRAFFGRFMLRAFGIPTTARPQPGHAALAHWTPDGWVINLGARWGIGWTKTRYKKDLDFLATTQAREDMDAYMMVKRAQWIGDVFDEERVFGLHGDTPGFWYGVSLHAQRGIIDDLEAKALAAVGEELGEANESKVKYDVVDTAVTDADRKIVVDRGTGTITVPAVACSKPRESTRKIRFMPSNLGGKQLHYNRVGKPEEFEYVVDAPRGGAYRLTARVITPTPEQFLRVAVNGAKEPVDIALPLTAGLWGATEPVEIALTQGRNLLRFSRIGEDIRGLTIRDFTLTPKE